MTRTLLAILILAGASLAVAQTPPVGTPAAGGRLPVPGGGTPTGLAPGGVPAPAPPLDPDIKPHLMAWEGAMKQATNFYAECNLVRKNAVLRREAAYKGSIMCLKPNLARMRLDKLPPTGAKPDTNDYTAYICTGKEVYEYDGVAKQVTEFKLMNGGVGDNLLLEFISGALTANDVVTRFDLALLKKEDPNWIFLEIKPRLPKDKAEFETMVLVLFRPNLPLAPGKGYLPRTVVIRKNNGQEEETWDFPNPVLNAQGITPSVFVYTPVPKELGWKFQPAQQTGK